MEQNVKWKEVGEMKKKLFTIILAFDFKLYE